MRDDGLTLRPNDDLPNLFRFHIFRFTKPDGESTGDVVVQTIIYFPDCLCTYKCCNSVATPARQRPSRGPFLKQRVDMGKTEEMEVLDLPHKSMEGTTGHRLFYACGAP